MRKEEPRLNPTQIASISLCVFLHQHQLPAIYPWDSQLSSDMLKLSSAACRADMSIVITLGLPSTLLSAFLPHDPKLDRAGLFYYHPL